MEKIPHFSEKQEGIQYLQISSKLLEMREVDQAMRHSKEWNEQVDIKNTEAMKNIIAEIGWPTKSKVGEEASRAAWLLVQHADHNPEFQEQCLILMREQPEGEIDLRDVAYLEDRIRVNTGRPTLYGTQFQETRDAETREKVIAYGPQPIEDLEGLNERRAAAGLGAFEEYKRDITQRYYPHFVEDDNGLPLITEVQQSLETLEQERAVEIDMRLSKSERESLDRIRIEQDLPQFDFYGAGVDTLKPELEKYFSEMGRNEPQDLSNISDIICRLSEGIREGFGEESTWIMVRVSLPNDEYEIPRWHPDGRDFASEKKRYKLVATLKGAQTLFGEAVEPDAFERLAQEQQANYNENDRAKFKEEDMRIRTELVKIVEPKDIGGEGKAVLYLVGENDAVLHSEPNITEPRIFMSVLSGSKEQIAQWQGRTRS